MWRRVWSRPSCATGATLSLGGALAALIVLAACGEPPPAYVRLDGPAPAVDAAPGRVLLVSFWATWCPPCREETPALLALAADPPRDLRIVVVSHDAGMAEVESLLGGPPDQALNLRLDPGKRVADAFGVAALPETFLVVDGRLVARFRGARRWSDGAMRALLTRLVDEAATS